MQRLLILLAPLLLTGCYTAQCIDDATYSAQMEPVSGFLWLAADHDATVACDQADQTTPSNCPTGYPGDQNFGTGPTVDLQTRDQSTQRKRIYARFYLPELPAGVQVVEARVSLFDPRPAGSTSDETLLVGAHAAGPWNAEEITWNSQPNSATILQQEFNLSSKLGQWTRAQDIAQLFIQPMMNGAEPNNGFIVGFYAIGQSFENSYPSDNSASRTQSDLGQAPRLLVRLSQPTACSALTLPNVPWSDTDLDSSLGGFPLSPVLMVRTSHTSWPNSWDVPPPL